MGLNAPERTKALSGFTGPHRTLTASPKGTAWREHLSTLTAGRHGKERSLCARFVAISVARINRSEPMRDRTFRTTMRILMLLVVALMASQVHAQEENCQYRRMDINNVQDGGPTVIHIRTTRGEDVRMFGYHDSGIYPWSVEYHWCGDGWTVEFRLGSACTRWEGDHMERQVTADGKRQLPCDWTAWDNAEFGDESPPGAPVMLAKLEGKT